MKVIILVGLPASGKTTYAKKLSKEPNWKRVSKDDLRDMVDRGIYFKKNEKHITAIQFSMIQYWIDQGFNVVIDNTHISKKFFDYTVTVLQGMIDVDIEVKSFLDVSLETLFERDENRESSVGRDVIQNMYDQNREAIDSRLYIRGNV